MSPSATRPPELAVMTRAGTQAPGQLDELHHDRAPRHATRPTAQIVTARGIPAAGCTGTCGTRRPSRQVDPYHDQIYADIRDRNAALPEELVALADEQTFLDLLAQIRPSDTDKTSGQPSSDPSLRRQECRRRQPSLSRPSRTVLRPHRGRADPARVHESGRNRACRATAAEACRGVPRITASSMSLFVEPPVDASVPVGRFRRHCG
jgi:hypothetical protein